MKEYYVLVNGVRHDREFAGNDYGREHAIMSGCLMSLAPDVVTTVVGVDDDGTETIIVTHRRGKCAE